MRKHDTLCTNIDECCDSRYARYLSNYEFYSNSIQFRVISSKQLEKFKNVQAFQLNQVINGSYKFDETTREVVLLKYDMWSRWLYEIENLFIELNGDRTNTFKVINDKHINYIVSLIDKTSDFFMDIVKNKHPDNFNQDFINIWLEMHQIAHDYLTDSIYDLLGINFNRAFGMIVDKIISVLQYSLVEIYELDNVSKNLDAFLIIEDLSMSLKRSTDKCLLLERALIYKKHFDINTFYIKNYTDEHFPISMAKKLEDHGINIDYKKSLTR